MSFVPENEGYHRNENAEAGVSRALVGIFAPDAIQEHGISHDLFYLYEAGEKGNDRNSRDLEGCLRQSVSQPVR